MSVKTTDKIVRSLSYLILTVIGLTMLAPLAWMVTTSLKEPGEVFQTPPKWIPTEQVFVRQGDRYLKVAWLPTNGKRVRVERLLERGHNTEVRIMDGSSRGKVITVRRKLLNVI